MEPAYFPFDRRNPGEMPLVSVAGAGAADFESRWTLMDTAGVEQASAVRGGRGRGGRPGFPGRSVRHHGRIGAAGGLRPGGIGGGLNSGEASSTIPARGQPPCQRCSPRLPAGWCSPISSSAGGYNTVITLINASDQTAVVTATAFDTDGMEIAPGFTIRIPTQVMDTLDWTAILGTGGGLRQGYFKLSIEPTYRPHPFATGPRVAGSVRIEAPASRAAVSLLNAGGDEFFFTPVRSDAG